MMLVAFVYERERERGGEGSFGEEVSGTLELESRGHYVLFGSSLIEMTLPLLKYTV